MVANFTPNPKLCVSYLDPLITFIDLSTGADSGVWDYGTGDTSLFLPGSHPSYTYSDTGTYTVTQYVRNSGNCVDSFSLEVCVKPDYTLYFPNAFRPGSATSVNNTFLPVGLGVSEFNMRIYNRWGEMVFESDDFLTGWDGTFGGK